MTRRTSLRFALTLAAVAASAIPLSGTATAHDDYCGTTHDMGTSTSGVVSLTNEDDYWRNSETGRARTFILTPSGGDADLAVYSDDCSTLLCSSSAGNTTVDTCTAPTSGAVQVRVYHYAGDAVSYTLTTASGYPSDDCGSGSGENIVSGFAGDAYVSLRMQARPDETWICTRIDNAVRSFGGKLVVGKVQPSVPVLPRFDGDVGACEETGAEVTVFDAGAQGKLDVYASVEHRELWLCLSSAALDTRVVVAIDDVVSLPTYAFQQDMAGRYSPEPSVPAAASGDCQRSGTAARRHADVTVDGVRTYLYSHVDSSQGLVRLCTRTGGEERGEGGVLEIRGQLGALPTVTPTGDISPCPMVYVLNELAGVGVSLPTASVCVDTPLGSYRVSVEPGTGAPASVTWRPDSGNLIE